MVGERCELAVYGAEGRGSPVLGVSVVEAAACWFDIAAFARGDCLDWTRARSGSGED